MITAERNSKRLSLKIRVIQPQLKECQQPPEIERGKKQILFYRLGRECGPGMLISDLWLPEL